MRTHILICNYGKSHDIVKNTTFRFYSFSCNFNSIKKPQTLIGSTKSKQLKLKGFFCKHFLLRNKNPTETRCLSKPKQKTASNQKEIIFLPHSTGSCKQPHSHRPWFSWGTSTTLTSAGKTIQLGRRNPGGSYRASMITF